MWFSGWMAMAWVNLSLKDRVSKFKDYWGHKQIDLHGLVKVLLGNGFVA